jgi:competence protein ComEC
VTAQDPGDARRPDGEQRQRPDLRLVPAFAAAWGAAGWAVGCGPRGTAAVAAGCALLGAVVASLSVRLRHRGLGPAPLAALSTSVLTLAAVTLVVAAASSRLAVRSRPPLPTWAADRAVVEARGQVSTDPYRLAEPTSGPWAQRPRAQPRFTVRVRLGTVSARGRTVTSEVPILVIGGPAWGDLGAGRLVALTARLAPAAPGDDVVAVARALGPPREVTSAGPVWRVADRLRVGLRDACTGLPAEAGALLPSLVVGDTSRLPDRLRADLQAAGLTHLTAVSGANVAIVAGAVLWLGTRLGVRRGLRLGIAAGVVAGFVVVARPQPSVLRAAAMGSIALLGTGLSRRPRGVPALAAAGILLLVADPWLARSAGFALSCAATAALLVLAPAWTSRWSRRMPRPVAAALAVPAAAQAGCGPLVALLTPSVSVVAVPANLLAEPAVAPATVAGVLAALVAPVSPPAAHLLAQAGALATGWIVRVAHTASGMPLAGLPWPAGPLGALLLAVLTAAVVTMSLVPSADRSTRSCGPDPPGSSGPPPRRSRRPPRSWSTRRARGPTRWPRRRAWLTVLVALALAAAIGWVIGILLPAGWPRGVRWPGQAVPRGWAVVQCDVGQGVATVVRSGPDRAVLLDTGPLPSRVDRCLRRLGVRHLDLVLLTHHHADHVQGLPGALRHRDAGQLLASPLAEPAGHAREVTRVAQAAGVPVRQGRAGVTGEAAAGGWAVRWRVLAPVDPPAPPPPGEDGDGTAVNESSLVAVLDVAGPAGSLRVLALGDLETEGQRRLLDRLASGRAGVDGPVDVLVVAHHGSARQEPGLCPALAPRVALIGVGADNDYGHPTPSALAMLRSCGASVRRTDLDGSIAVVPASDGTLTVVTDRPS